MSRGGLHRFFSADPDRNSSKRIVSASGITPSYVVNTAQGLVNVDIGKNRKRLLPNPTAEVKLKAARYAIDQDSPTAALKKFRVEYPDYSFSRQSISRWSILLQKAIKAGSTVSERIFPEHVGRPYVLDERLMRFVKDLIVGSREAGAVILRNDVINIGNGVIMAEQPNILVENGGHVKLTDKWARNVLFTLGYSKRRQTTSKRQICDMLYEEVKLQFQIEISILVKEHSIPPGLIINFDQTPLSFVSNGKYTFASRGAKSVPIANADDKRAITGTFGCTADGKFLGIQLIYTGKTPRCLPVYNFPENYDVIFNPKHWANQETAISFLKNIILPFVIDERGNRTGDRPWTEDRPPTVIRSDRHPISYNFRIFWTEDRPLQIMCNGYL